MEEVRLTNEKFYPWGQLSKSAQRALLCFCDPIDAHARVELILLNKEALQWLWTHLAFFKLDISDLLRGVVPQSEFVELTLKAVEQIEEKSEDLIKIAEYLKTLTLPFVGNVPNELKTSVEGNLNEYYRVGMKMNMKYVIEHCNKQVRLGLIKGLSKRSSDWYFQIIDKNDLSREEIELFAASKDKFVRRELCRTQLQRHSNYFDIFLHLLGDTDEKVMDIAHVVVRNFNNNNRFTFSPLFAYRVYEDYLDFEKKDRNAWIAWGRKTEIKETNLGPFILDSDFEEVNNTLAIGQEGQGEPLLIDASKKNYKLKKWTRTFPTIPRLKISYESINGKIEAYLRMEVRLGNKRFQWWVDQLGRGVGWTSKDNIKRKEVLSTEEIIVPEELPKIDAIFREFFSKEIEL